MRSIEDDGRGGAVNIEHDASKVTINTIKVRIIMVDIRIFQAVIKSSQHKALTCKQT